MILWKINKTLRLRIVAEQSGLTIQYKIYSPLGLFEEGTATDLGNNQYQIEFTPNEYGMWFVKWIFPDNFELIHYVIVTQYDSEDILKELKKHDSKMTAFHFMK